MVELFTAKQLDYITSIVRTQDNGIQDVNVGLNLTFNRPNHHRNKLFCNIILIISYVTSCNIL